MIFFAAMPNVLMRRVPTILPLAAAASATAASISRIIGAMRSWRRDPAAVGATLRVVRLSSSTPSRASSWRMIWLRAEGDRPRWSAARAKLARSTTATKAFNSANSDPRIMHYSLNSPGGL